MQTVFDKKSNIRNDGLIDPLIPSDRYDICPHCRAQRIELISFNGYSQNYKEAINAYMQGYTVEFNRYEIRSMRCRGCHKEFVIDWTPGFPVPLRNTYRTDRFFAEFMEGH